ncbi:hypothetical protein MAR_018431 [Mya arenaria]|uniref:Uncharacterized protein n=1 Tax=Mya arenaria TaxID=6604 RepID=A0ABY7EEM9_MYAAR|nr:hypothetical protein MAR_018431 [Mya arenaria]
MSEFVHLWTTSLSHPGGRLLHLQTFYRLCEALHWFSLMAPIVRLYGRVKCEKTGYLGRDGVVIRHDMYNLTSAPIMVLDYVCRTKGRRAEKYAAGSVPASDPNAECSYSGNDVLTEGDELLRRGSPCLVRLEGSTSWTSVAAKPFTNHGRCPVGELENLIEAKVARGYILMVQENLFEAKVTRGFILMMQENLIEAKVTRGYILMVQENLIEAKENPFEAKVTRGYILMVQENLIEAKVTLGYILMAQENLFTEKD